MNQGTSCIFISDSDFSKLKSLFPNMDLSDWTLIEGPYGSGYYTEESFDVSDALDYGITVHYFLYIKSSQTAIW